MIEVGDTFDSIDDVPEELRSALGSDLTRWEDSPPYLKQNIHLALEKQEFLIGFGDLNGRFHEKYRSAELHTLCALQKDNVKGADFTLCAQGLKDLGYKYTCFGLDGSVSFHKNLPENLSPFSLFLPSGTYGMYTWDVLKTWVVIGNKVIIDYDVVLLKPYGVFQTGEIVVKSTNLNLGTISLSGIEATRSEKIKFMMSEVTE